MKTLVIHPDDRTTDFLYHIYENMDDIYVINDPYIDEDRIADIIPSYDRIICLGHGGPGGLFGKGGYIISEYHASLLRSKELVFIWCNADMFMKENGLKGFYSGMFISEVGEAAYYDIEATQEQVDYSNYMFANLLGKHIEDEDRLEKIKEGYKVKGDKVVKFNNDRLYEEDNSIDWEEKEHDFNLNYFDDEMYPFDYDDEEDSEFETDIRFHTYEDRWEEEYDCEFFNQESSFYDFTK